MTHPFASRRRAALAAGTVAALAVAGLAAGTSYAAATSGPDTAAVAGPQDPSAPATPADTDVNDTPAALAAAARTAAVAQDAPAATEPAGVGAADAHGARPLRLHRHRAVAGRPRRVPDRPEHPRTGPGGARLRLAPTTRPSG